jgi:hypothetical protein
MSKTYPSSSARSTSRWPPTPTRPRLAGRALYPRGRRPDGADPPPHFLPSPGGLRLGGDDPSHRKRRGAAGGARLGRCRSHGHQRQLSGTASVGDDGGDSGGGVAAGRGEAAAGGGGAAAGGEGAAARGGCGRRRRGCGRLNRPASSDPGPTAVTLATPDATLCVAAGGCLPVAR